MDCLLPKPDLDLFFTFSTVPSHSTPANIASVLLPSPQRLQSSNSPPVDRVWCHQTLLPSRQCLLSSRQRLVPSESTAVKASSSAAKAKSTAVQAILPPSRLSLVQSLRPSRQRFPLSGNFYCRLLSQCQGPDVTVHSHQGTYHRL